MKEPGMRNGSRQSKKTAVRAGNVKKRKVAPPANLQPCIVVGIGASAGGLDACRKLVGAIPANSGIAFILVQHLEPTHESMMVDLLSDRTSLTVLQAIDGAEIKPNHLYIIPPGTYLSIVNQKLHVSPPNARHGARLPFDFLLHAMADELGARSVCVILSGTGADGSVGLRAIKAAGGLVLAQDPDEAGYGGMPRSAIRTGAVDFVLPVLKIPQAIVDRKQTRRRNPDSSNSVRGILPRNGVSEIVELLRATTTHDFTLYKSGTLRRRIERRMAMGSIKLDELGKYLEILRSDAGEREALANDLLINVTQFFRDAEVFEFLAEKVVPDLLRDLPTGHTLRIWIAGCSTGEETYSLAMVFRDAIAAEKREIKLQVFASDVDSEAVAQAREGIYPASIESNVSADRLARFFAKEDKNYRVLPELRASVVFTVQDLLADPPFSRLDFISCRNLLIYLSPEAQAKVISLFNFSLRKGGILLLGGAETIRTSDTRFEEISKAARIYRHTGSRKQGAIGSTPVLLDGMRTPARPKPGGTASRQSVYAELCRRVVMDSFAPAAILINRNHECLYTLGPTDRYLRLAQGPPSHDLLAMIREGTRIILRATIQQAMRENARVVVPGGRMERDGVEISFSISAQPVTCEGEKLFLICFIDAPKEPQRRTQALAKLEGSRVGELEHELEATRVELQGAIRNLEISTEDQRAINEEALSVNEEYQSTNEELLTSKEELQSLNEELVALNSQLQETLERQRTTSNDLKNVLYSTDVATIFLDRDLNIRLFTPATKSLFRVIPSDVGRPLADLQSLASDTTLLADARSVLRDLAPAEREIMSQSGIWFIRRILPYRSHDDSILGVVITFTDVTDRKHIALALEAAKLQAEQANLAKSRFLAAASHDLRQPLQTLALLQGLLAKAGDPARIQKLVTRLDETLAAMSGMLNTLLDINQIEAGIVRAEISAFPVADLFNRLREEFAFFVESQNIELTIVPSSLSISSDRHLLEQMLRNLISNAFKYTKSGKVLVGCRRRPGGISIEVCDTGIGIPEAEFDSIFEEYHQLDNTARERNRGLGLGLSIVRRLGKLLGHEVRVRSKVGAGSIFDIEIPEVGGTALIAPSERRSNENTGSDGPAPRTGAILIVEDDPVVRELLDILLVEEGHQVVVASHGIVALDLIQRGVIRPDLVLADYNLPNGMDGLQTVMKVREKLHRLVPVIILSGDISTEALHKISLQNCVHLNKPIKAVELVQAIQRLLPKRRGAERNAGPDGNAGIETRGATIYVVDDDDDVRDALGSVIEADGRIVKKYGNSESFLAAYRPGGEGCLLIDAYLPGMNGIELLQHLRSIGGLLPAIVITGNSDVPMAVEAMKAGAIDFIEKPVGSAELLVSVSRALEHSKDSRKLAAWKSNAAKQIASLSERQRLIMDMVLAGQPSKNIAADLGISQRTVENHRAAIMRKTGAKSLPALARLAIAASSNGDKASAMSR